MSDEASNVAVLKDAYRRWHDSKGGSVDHWMGLVADDIKFGSLAQAAAEMAFAGGLGIEIHLEPLATRTGITVDAVLLFSESNSRFLVEVPPAEWPQFADYFAGLPLTELGKVTGGKAVEIRGVAGQSVVDAPWAELKKCWQSPLHLTHRAIITPTMPTSSPIIRWGLAPLPRSSLTTASTAARRS